MTEFDRFAALSFDCYGTLIDWETGIVEALRPWTSRHGIDDETLLSAFAAHETVVESEHPTMRYPGVLTDDLAARRRRARRRRHRRGAERRSAPRCRTGRRSRTRPTRSPQLHERFRLIILSNIDRTSFAASARRLGIEFDLVITAEDVGSYKPSPANFAALLDATAGTELLHVAQSLYHDHEPAKAAGLPTVWIDRRHDRTGTGATPTAGPVTPDWRFPSMAAFAEAAVG